ncbi:MAG: HlyD family efflux transporter periplasmic adaptor subunit [Chloroflexi bacterium]|jgi:HlyD family secretion protein|nr:HlyD family efflux transporter periplasmic adaptor subunit [Chloroflexota bacterium]
MKKRSLFVLIVVGLLTLSACELPTQTVETATPEPVVQNFTPVVSATGKLLPAEEATLSMKTGGVVAEVLAGEDDSVIAGQVLVRLEGRETLEAAIAATRFEVVSAQQALDALFDDPELALAKAQQSIADAELAIEDAERRINNLHRIAVQADIDQAYANMILAKDKLDKAQEDYEPYEGKAEDDLTRANYLSRMAQAQKDYDATVRLYNALTGTGDDLDIAEAESDLVLAQAQLIVSQREFEILQKGPDPDDIAVAEARLANAEAQLAAAEAALDDLVLSAPFDGTIGNLNIHTGEWVSPGQPVILLADLNHMQVETTDLNEIDVAQIKIGDTALVTFDALPEALVNGTVVRIAPKDSEGSGVNYPVLIELDEVPAGLRWGMTAFVDIEIGE